jgi:hypothetical protein
MVVRTEMSRAATYPMARMFAHLNPGPYLAPRHSRGFPGHRRRCCRSRSQGRSGVFIGAPVQENTARNVSEAKHGLR